MALTLEKTLKPLRHWFDDIIQTFIPYTHQGEVKLFDLFTFDKDKKAIAKSQEVRDSSVEGDLIQPFRGIVNMGKGVGRTLRGLVRLVVLLSLIGVPLLIFFENEWTAKIVTGDGYRQKKEYKFSSNWDTFKQVVKKLTYDLLNGIGILLQGAWQLVTTPLLFIRIPLRLAVTEAIKNRHEYEKYNAMKLFGRQSDYSYNLLHFPLEKTAADLKGTLAPYDNENGNLFLFLNVVSDFAQPLYGVGNTMLGAFVLVFALIRNLFILPELAIRCGLRGDSVEDVLWYQPKDTSIYEQNKGGSFYNTRMGCEFLLRGLLQIITTPFQYCIRMPLRGIISYHLLHNTWGEQSSILSDSDDEKQPPKNTHTSPQTTENSGRDVHSTSYGSGLLKETPKPANRDDTPKKELDAYKKYGFNYKVMA